MSEMPEGCGDGSMPAPNTEHSELMKAVGTWNVAARFFMGGPEAPPMESKAVDTCEAVGGFFVVGHYKSDFMGMPFEGRSCIGFNTFTGEYASTWCDSMSPHLMHMTGKREGDTITLTGPGHDPMTGASCGYRMTDKAISDDERYMEMFVTPEGGSEVKIFEMDYKRA